MLLRCWNCRFGFIELERQSAKFTTSDVSVFKRDKHSGSSQSLSRGPAPMILSPKPLICKYVNCEGAGCTRRTYAVGQATFSSMASEGAALVGFLIQIFWLLQFQWSINFTEHYWKQFCRRCRYYLNIRGKRLSTIFRWCVTKLETCALWMVSLILLVNITESVWWKDADFENFIIAKTKQGTWYD